MTDFPRLIGTLADAGVEFVLIGGVAAVAHGSARLTQDIDVVYSRRLANLDRIVEALRPHAPYLRGAPPGLPFALDRETLVHGLNFTLETSIGDIDLFGEVAGGGSFEDLVPHTIRLRIFGHEVLCLSLDKLIEVKRAAGRPKDLEAISELEAIREESGPEEKSGE